VDAKINGLERQLNETVKELSNGFKEMAESLKNWKASVEEQLRTRSEQVSALQMSATTNTSTIATLTTGHTEQAAQIRALTTVIHGDPTIVDGQPSLFRLLADIRSEMRTSNELYSSRIGDTMILVQQHGKYIDERKAEIIAQQIRREKIRRFALDTFRWVSKNKWFLALTAALIALIVNTIAPWALPILNRLFP